MVTPTLSSVSPVKLNYGLDSGFNLKGNYLYFDSGLSLYSIPLLENCLDVAINKDNLLFLTDSLHLADVTTTVGDSLLKLEDYIGSTTISVSGTNLSLDVSNGVLGTTDGILIQTQDLFFILFDGTSTISATNTPDSMVFFIEFANNLVAIRNSYSQYITFDPYTFTIGFSAQVLPDTYNLQHFAYVIDGQNVVLSTATSLLTSQRVVYFDTTTGALSTDVATNPFTSSHIFVFGSFVETGINSFPAVQSNWVTYDRKDQSVNIVTDKSVVDTQHNLLVSTPFKALTNTGLDVNVNNLKNYQTPEYGYILKDGLPYGRNYNKLIAGVNQEQGYENLYLSFDAETQEIRFEKDKYTYFHFAPTAEIAPLSSSSLVYSGAVAGKTPWRSDKIFKKQADYKKYSNWGNSSNQDGAWFCSWLSGNHDSSVQPVWMDRYYDPNYSALPGISLTYALLTAIGNDLVQGIENPIIWDTPSTMQFEPGGLYIYHHVGEERNTEVVDNLKSYTGLLIDFTTWGSETSSTITDSSGNGYDGTIFGFELSANQVTIDNIVNKGYNINGTYGYVEKVDSIFNNDELTISFYLHADDWNNVIGDQIVGNYYNGGIGVFNNNQVLTPYITLFDPVSGYVFHLNTNFKVLNKTIFIPYNNSRPLAFAKTMYDEDYHILDSNQNILVYDSENVLQNIISLDSKVPGISATQMAIDGDYNYHLFDKVTSYYYKLSPTGSLLASINITVGDYFVLDYKGIAHFAPTTGVIGGTINSQGNIYFITSNYLYRDGIIIWQGANIESVLCDEEDNIWLIYGSNNIAKLDHVNNLIFAVPTPHSTSGVGKRSMSFVCELMPTGINKFIVIFDDRTQYAHKMTTSGTFTSSVPTSAFTGSLVNLTTLSLRGVSNNGFEFQRKYVAPNVITPGISVKAFLHEQYINGLNKRIKLQASTKDFHGTKHVAVTFNYANGNIKLYIDGDLVASEEFEPFKYHISANKNILSLVIGTNSSKRDVLVNDLQQPGYYTFDGVIGDLRIFSKDLDAWDIKALSQNIFTIAYHPLTWNMPIGSRNYVEEIERFFKHKMPGNKSQFFNIRLSGLNITDSVIRGLIEDSIKGVLTRINPVHVTLNQIIWE